MPLSRERLLAHCRALPHVTEDVKWGADLVFSIGGKMFAVFALHGTDAGFGCKVHEDDFADVTRVDGIVPSPYAARYHWIRVEDPKLLPEREAKALLSTSYELVKAKLSLKLQAALGGETVKVAAKKASAKSKKARSAKSAPSSGGRTKRSTSATTKKSAR